MAALSSLPGAEAETDSDAEAASARPKSAAPTTGASAKSRATGMSPSGRDGETAGALPNPETGAAGAAATEGAGATVETPEDAAAGTAPSARPLDASQTSRTAFSLACSRLRRFSRSSSLKPEKTRCENRKGAPPASSPARAAESEGAADESDEVGETDEGNCAVSPAPRPESEADWGKRSADAPEEGAGGREGEGPGAIESDRPASAAAAPTPAKPSRPTPRCQAL